MKRLLYLCLLALVGCNNNPRTIDTTENTLVGKWRVEKIMIVDSTKIFRSTPSEFVNPYHFKKERSEAIGVGATITFSANGELETDFIISTNLGKPKWRSNSQGDSLFFMLVGVQNEFLASEGIVDKNGVMIVREGKINFTDNNNIDWFTNEGLMVTLKRNSRITFHNL